MKRMVVLLGLLTLGGCYHYEPPVATDRLAEAYQTDLAACQESGVDAVNKRNAKKALAWVASPATRLFQIRAAIRACVRSKGYVEG